MGGLAREVRGGYPGSVADDPTPFGAELAARVVAELKKGRRLVNDHRDFCGMGLLWSRGKFYYAYALDGELAVRGEGWTPDHDEKVFSSDEDFLSWLSRQSDRSLDGSGRTDPHFYDNQRVTRARLLEFAGGASSRLP